MKTFPLARLPALVWLAAAQIATEMLCLLGAKAGPGAAPGAPAHGAAL